MRSLRLLQDASVCEDASALRDPKVKTHSQLLAHDHSQCPLFGRCNTGDLLGPSLRNCVPRMAQDVAHFAAKSGGSVESEMGDFRRAPVFSDMGFIDPYADPDPDATITDKDEICERVESWARVILGGKVLTLNEQLASASCSDHENFEDGCDACRIARLAVADRTVMVWPGGVPERVPRDKCRCPILRVGDLCPVHGG